MSHSLKAGYLGDYYRDTEGDNRSFDDGSNAASRLQASITQMAPCISRWLGLWVLVEQHFAFLCIPGPNID